MTHNQAIEQQTMNSLDSTEVHNTDDDGRLDEEQYEEIHRLSQESLERRRDAELPTCGEPSAGEELVLGLERHTFEPGLGLTCTMNKPQFGHGCKDFYSLLLLLFFYFFKDWT